MRELEDKLFNVMISWVYITWIIWQEAERENDSFGPKRQLKIMSMWKKDSDGPWNTLWDMFSNFKVIKYYKTKITKQQLHFPVLYNFSY